MPQDAHLDDLQSELEAGVRTLDKIQSEITILDGLRRDVRHAEVLGGVLQQVRQLRASVQAQRATLRELRREMHKLRMKAAQTRRVGAQLRGRRTSGRTSE